MKAKQTAPLLVTLAPLAAVAPSLLVGGAIGLALVWLLKCALDDDKDTPPDTAADAESQRKATETPAIRQIPPKPIVRLMSAPVPPATRVPVQPAPVPPVPLIRAPVPIVAPMVKGVTAAAPQPIIKKFVTRADLAAIFDNGARSLNRTTAVAALKRLGFGKTAAYAALSPDGRFNAWLICASDGMITWEN